MVNKKLEIVWDTKAKLKLKEIYVLIKKESPNSAQKVASEIRQTIRKAALNPKLFEIDRFKLNNDGSYRAFQKFSYRVVFRFDEKKLFVLRIRHAKQEPLEY